MSFGFNIALISAGFFSLGTGAMAQPGASSPTGGPGKISAMSRTDLQAALEQRFDAADSNRDGTLTPDERTANAKTRREAGRERMFARLDTDRNGSISKEEFDAARQGRHRVNRAGSMAMRRPFAAAVDKPLTRSDFLSSGLTRFDRLDTDRDGKISSAERDAARKALRDHHLAPAHTPQTRPPGS